MSNKSKPCQVKVCIAFYGLVYSIIYSENTAPMEGNESFIPSMRSGHNSQFAFALQMNLRDVSLCNNPLIILKYSKYTSERLHLNCTCTLCIIFSLILAWMQFPQLWGTNNSQCIHQKISFNTFPLSTFQNRYFTLALCWGLLKLKPGLLRTAGCFG